MPQRQDNFLSRSSSSPPPLPGYTVLSGPDHRTYLVPSALLHTTQQAFEAERLRQELGADAAATGPRSVYNLPFTGIAAGDIMVPADPLPTDREALIVHAEILAMQSRWGISYKDAAHRLYLAEVEKFRAAQQAENGMHSLRDRIHNTLIYEISPVIDHIDQLELPAPTAIGRGNDPQI